MKLILALLLVSHSALAIDVGDGTDGACNVTGGADTQITSARKYYQCTSLDLDGNLDEFSGNYPSGAGGAPLIIKVQGNVTVASSVTINLSGADGMAGDIATGVKPGGDGGAGGNKGGNSPGVGVDGLNGSGEGGGFAGVYIIPFGTSSYGSGGGGGSYQTKAINQGIDGDDGGGPGAPNSGGLNGVVFGSESTFDSSFIGGSGGASGGGSLDNGTPYSGSTGGGGGGALRIIAGGNITVNGSIISKGGNGGGEGSVTLPAPIPGTPFSAGGGGGSGGAIWLQAGGTLTVAASGVITALGGQKGDNDLMIAGGDGGEGRIRLDSGNGAIDIMPGATVSPTPHTASFTPTSAISRQYASGVSCASIALDDHEKPFNNLMNLILGLTIAGLAHYLVSRKSKV